MNARIAIIVSIPLLCLGFAQSVISSENPGGKIVWWGQPIWPDLQIRGHTNGVIEYQNEIVRGAVALPAGGGLAIRKDGTVFAFGSQSSISADALKGLTNVASIATGDSYSWVVRHDGTVVRWGDVQDDDGLVATLSNIVSIFPEGGGRCFALKKDGSVLELHLSAPKSVALQVRVGGQVLTNVTAIVPVKFSFLVLKSDGSIVNLQLAPGTGRSSTINQVDADGRTWEISSDYPPTEPLIVDGLAVTNIATLAVEGDRTLAVTRDGYIIAWRNDHSDTNLPAGLTNIAAISLVGATGIALKRDGTLITWGGSLPELKSAPAGLSNVIAIAAGWPACFAITTGDLPPSVYIIPHGELEQNERKADLVFKGQAISTRAVTNSLFPDWAKTHATEFKVITVFKGKPNSDKLTFWHYTEPPQSWGGGTQPEPHQFEAGKSYLVFAENMDKKDYLYTVPPDAALRTNEFRQVYHGGVLRTLNNRPMDRVGFKEAYWQELLSLLYDTNPTNQLYAIEKLDEMSEVGRRNRGWIAFGQSLSDDFKRATVLSVLVPLTKSSDEEVANNAIRCFATESDSANELEPFANDLIQVANSGPSTARRLNAIDSLSGTHFEAISNSLAKLLHNSDEQVRANATDLLERCPGEFSQSALRELVRDDSPFVRGAAADIIGSGKIESLVPTLAQLFADPVGLKEPVAPWKFENLDEGGRGVKQDVHNSAGCALLKFDNKQVGGILKSNLVDREFRLQFLCKLAQDDAKPWVADLIQAMQIRRARKLKKAAEDHFAPETYMTLSGAAFQAWNILYEYLTAVPAADFAEGKQDRCLSVLENAGNTGSRELTQLYKLYRLKGLDERATKYRERCLKVAGYDMSDLFRQVDDGLARQAAVK